MDNERVKALTDSIEKAYRELLEITEDNYITGFIVDGAFVLYTYNKKVDIYRSGKDE